MLKTAAALALVFASPAFHAAATPPVSIHVEIAGLRSDRGHVMCFLYSSEKGFPKDQSAAVAKISNTIHDGKSSCDFAAAAPGTYAVSIYHDENDNGRMDTNFIGMPKEGVSASNDAKGHMGPPKFRDAQFQVGPAPVRLLVHMTYL